jgi:hypothetical protein
MGPGAAPSPLERSWPDSVTREDRLLREHPEWTIKRIRPEVIGTHPTTYEATDGTVTLRSVDLGAVLDMIEHALREGDEKR